MATAGKGFDEDGRESAGQVLLDEIIFRKGTVTQALNWLCLGKILLTSWHCIR